jgi:hypothetical protein
MIAWRVIIGRQRTSRIMEAVGREGPLLDAVRKLRETSDRDTLFQMQTRTFDESLQVRETRMIVLNEQAR